MLHIPTLLLRALGCVLGSMKPCSLSWSQCGKRRGDFFFPDDRRVQRAADALAVQRFDLLAHQVTPLERRVLGATLVG